MDELLDRVRGMKPKKFEQLVVDVLVAMGYGGSQLDAAQVVGKSGDGGIDGVIKEDRLGLDMVYVQAKRHEADIGPGAIREFVGLSGRAQGVPRRVYYVRRIHVGGKNARRRPTSGSSLLTGIN